MALLPKKYFGDIGDFFEDDDWFFPVVSGKENMPEMDIYEEDEKIVAEISTPGMNTEDLNIVVEGNVLRVRGEKKEEKQEDDEKGYYRREIKRGSFERAVRLPSNIDEDNVTAEYKEGILRVEIPKREEGKAGKEVKIKKK